MTKDIKDARIAELEKQSQKQQQQIRERDQRIEELEQQNKKQKQRNKELEQQNEKQGQEIGKLRDKIKEKNRKLNTARVQTSRALKKKEVIEDVVEQGSSTGTNRTIANHEYAERIIRLALMLYVYAGCSYRSAVRAMEVFHYFLVPFLPDGKLINYTTICTWVHKAGLDVLKHRPETFEGAYALVFDLSITIGDQQMILALGVPATPDGNPIEQADAIVVDMEARSSWPAEAVLDFANNAIRKMGRKPMYCVSDEGSNFKKALPQLGVPHHIDISHRFATIIRHAFTESSTVDNTDFEQFNKAYGRTRRLALTDCAYLMPPAIRSKGRFMNMFPITRWATSMLDNWHKLNPSERYHFNFVNQYSSLVNEMDEITQCYRKMMKLCKHQGLSKETAMQCLQICKPLSYGTPRQRSIYQDIHAYIAHEVSMLTEEQPTCHVSSDIIETMFSSLKRKLSCNHFDGITATCLVLPLRPDLSVLERASAFNIKDRFERTSIADVKAWKKGNLPGGRTSLRRNTLNLNKVVNF